VTAVDSSKLTRVVVVEDDPQIRKLLVNVLQGMPGFTVVAEFGEGRLAIRSLAATLPDLMLVDLGLPDIAGIEVIRQITTVCPECDVLVVTTFGDEPSIFSALEAGASGYLLKGGTEEELRRDIREVRSGGSPLSPAIARKVVNEFSRTRRTRSRNRTQAPSLTERETKILELVSRGYSYDETAKQLVITRDTVHSHLKSIYRKLKVHSKMEAVFEARRKNIIS